MAKRKPMIKDDKTQKKPRNAGKVTLQDYKDISKQLGVYIGSLDAATSLFSKWAGIKARIDHKIQQLEKRGREPVKPKQKVKYKCLQCNEVHEKRETIYQCPSCHSKSIEPML